MQTNQTYHLVQVVVRQNNLYFSELMHLTESHQIYIPKPALKWARPTIAAGGVLLLSTSAALLKNRAMRNANSVEELNTQYH
jgi:hypothetical protein